jgi:hypothetical protein
MEISKRVFVIMLVAFIALLTSCNEETQEGTKIYPYKLYWNLEDYPTVSFTLDRNLEEVDNIIIKVKSDKDEILFINTYIIFENSIEITAPNYIDVTNYNMNNFDRLEINLIYYN